MKNVVLICLFALLAGCAFETAPEQDIDVDTPEYETEGVFEGGESYRDPCSYVGGVHTVYINGKEYIVYEPVVCLQTPELFPELKPDIIDDKVNNRIDDRIRVPFEDISVPFEDVIEGRVQ